MDIKSQLYNKIDEFLAEHRESVGGWVFVAPKDLEQLDEIINWLLAAKYDLDHDGDLPVEFKLIDRTRFERMYYKPVPYNDGVPPHSEKDDQLIDTLSFNVVMATHAIQQYLSERNYRTALEKGK